MPSHAAAYSEGCGYCGQDRDDQVEDEFPFFFAHNNLRLMINTVSFGKDWWDSHLQSYNIRKWKCEVGRRAVKKSEIM